ncbi:hypothetical protein F7P10_31120 [Actinomadura sp. WMMB 499]|nr:hypothetical protein F7P10_31120 [Actinomadura sp. WMMB 499]
MPGAGAELLGEPPCESTRRNARLCRHALGGEEAFVVSGTFNDGDRDYPSGSFIHAPAGSSHVPQTTEGCTLLLFYPEG